MFSCVTTMELMTAPTDMCYSARHPDAAGTTTFTTTTSSSSLSSTNKLLMDTLWAIQGQSAKLAPASEQAQAGALFVPTWSCAQAPGILPADAAPAGGGVFSPLLQASWAGIVHVQHFAPQLPAQTWPCSSQHTHTPVHVPSGGQFSLPYHWPADAGHMEAGCPDGSFHLPTMSAHNGQWNVCASLPVSDALCHEGHVTSQGLCWAPVRDPAQYSSNSTTALPATTLWPSSNGIMAPAHGSAAALLSAAPCASSELRTGGMRDATMNKTAKRKRTAGYQWNTLQEDGRAPALGGAQGPAQQDVGMLHFGDSPAVSATMWTGLMCTVSTSSLRRMRKRAHTMVQKDWTPKGHVNTAKATIKPAAQKRTAASHAAADRGTGAGRVVTGGASAASMCVSTKLHTASQYLVAAEVSQMSHGPLSNGQATSSHSTSVELGPSVSELMDSTSEPSVRPQSGEASDSRSEGSRPSLEPSEAYTSSSPRSHPTPNTQGQASSSRSSHSSHSTASSSCASYSAASFTARSGASDSSCGGNSDSSSNNSGTSDSNHGHSDSNGGISDSNDEQ